MKTLLRLTDRDFKLFSLLSEYGLLSTSQIYRKVFRGVDKRTMLRRLRKLHKHRCLSFVTGPNQGGYVWYLSQKSLKLLGSDFAIKGVNRNSLEHDLLVNEMRFSLEQTGFTETWISSHRMRQTDPQGVSPYARSSDTIPDWIFTLETKQYGPRSIAMEVEITYKGPKRMQSQIYRYVHKDSIHYSWYLVPSIEFGRKILKDFKPYAGYKSNSWLWFSLIDEVKNKPLEARIFTLKNKFCLKDIAEKTTQIKKKKYHRRGARNAHTSVHSVSTKQ